MIIAVMAPPTKKEHRAIQVPTDNCSVPLIPCPLVQPLATLAPENQHRLESYPWSSYLYYLKPPSQRPEWLTAEWVLGHNSMKDTVHGRRQSAEMIQSRARNTLEDGDDFYESIKGDRVKVLLAAYIKTHYSLSNPRISSLLHMGHPTRISRCSLMVERDRTLKRMYRDLEKFIHEE